MWYRRPQGLLAGLRDAIDRAPMVIRLAVDPTLRQHARDGVPARGVQFFDGLPLCKAHPLQGASFDRMWNMAWPRWHFCPQNFRRATQQTEIVSPRKGIAFLTNQRLDGARPKVSRRRAIEPAPRL